jgi:hypothetical protein
MSEDRGVMFRENQQDVMTPILPAHVNSFNMVAFAGTNSSLHNALNPQEPKIEVSDITQKQEAVMNSINAPAQNFESSAPIMRQMGESDIMAVSNSAMKMGGELLGRAFDLFGGDQDNSPKAMDQDPNMKLQMAMQPKPPTMQFGMGVGIGGL